MLRGLIRIWWCVSGVFFLVGALRADESVARLQWLREEIARHDDLYFKKATSEISDGEYDRLKQELQTLEKTVPPAGVGDDRGGDFPVYRHRRPMLSLEKVYTEAGLRAFVEKAQRAIGISGVRWVVEPKFDGLAINVTYEQGRLVRAVTRGDGQEGDDVTENLKVMGDLPRELPAGAPEVVEVRGEVYMEFREFARINAERVAAGEEAFAHPRNLAAGTLKSKDAAEVAKRRLSLVFYGLGAWEGAVKAPESQQGLHALFRAWGLPGVKQWLVVKGDEVWAAVKTLGPDRATWAFPTDGLVFKVDSCALQSVLGESEVVPRWAVAYKFSPQRATTRLRAITLQVGRTGLITPVAELEPVNVGGTTVARATLHNAEEIVRRDLRVGDFVYVEKAGEIIPAITGVDVSRRGPGPTVFVFPENCPSCGNVLKRESAMVWCPNKRCAAQVRRRVEFFAAPAGVGIKGLGPALIERWVASGRVKDVADLYRLTRRDGVSERVLAEIVRSRRAEWGRYVFALGFTGGGKKGAADLAVRYHSLAELARAPELDEEERALVAQLVVLGVDPQSRGLMEEKH